MAKQRLNFFELHLEKLAVGVVAALFLWVIYAFVVTSPNKDELNGQMVGPSRIDEQVKDTAERVLAALRNAKLEAEKVENFPEMQANYAKGPLSWTDVQLAANLPRTVHFRPPPPDVRGPGEPGRVTLATLLPPDKPKVTAGRLSGLFPPRTVPVGDSLTDQEWDVMEVLGPQDRSWVTVGARLDFKKQERVFLENEYQTHKFDILVTDVVLQRQMRLPDGHWSEWEFVDDYTEYQMPAPPQLGLMDLGGDKGMIVPADLRNQLFAWRDLLKEYHAALVRPRLPEAEFGDRWTPPLLQKLAELYPEEGWQYKPPEMQEDRPKSPRKRAEQDLSRARDLLAADNLEEAQKLVQEIVRNKRVNNRRLTEQAQQLLSEIELKRKEKMLAALMKEDEEEQFEEEKRPTEGVFFAHDLTAERAETYRYRMKLDAFNTYAGFIDRLKNQMDAVTPFITTEWSEPSEPVEMPPLQRFYVTSTKIEKDKREARFDVYKWIRGEWVENSFSTDVGEPIGEERRVSHSQERSKILVDFNTGVRLVDINPRRIYIPRDTQRDGSFRLGDPELSEAVLCVSHSGDTFERLLLADKDDPTKRMIEEEIDNMRRARRPRTKAGPKDSRGGRGGRGGGGGIGGGG